ncbi:uncharacterized protein LOC117784273 [Drosophila innubila]|uniref:uncharacterized protein LOC117784273 n=1 Tax=Drosophila innubila TaxID=198719 RepID=UPI00148DB51D|nr:uncharacterized protein LOC117784273 [Drosophila innubila]
MVLLTKGFCCMDLNVACTIIAFTDVIINTIMAVVFEHDFSYNVWMAFLILQITSSILLMYALAAESHRFCLPFLLITFARLVWAISLFILQLYNVENYVFLASEICIIVIDSYFWITVYSFYLYCGGEALCWA